METKLARISEISTKRPDTKLSSIGHLINAEMLRECHNEIMVLLKTEAVCQG